MPWTAHYFADGVCVAFTGETTGDEIVQANTDFYAHAYEIGPRFAVFDFSAVERFDVQGEAVKRIVAQDLIAADGAVRELAVAVIAPEPGPYYISRVWQLSIEETPWRVRVVHSWNGALRWLSDQGIATEQLAALQR